MTDPNYIVEARRLADQGYGWHDIVVRLNHRIALATAKYIVIEQELRRINKRWREGA